MNDVTKFIIQFVVIPLIMTLISLVTFLCRNEIKALREKINEEKKERKEQIGKLNMDMKENTTHNNEDMRNIFLLLNEINEKLGDVKGKMSVQEERIHNLKDTVSKK